jgi:hypothetical protein
MPGRRRRLTRTHVVWALAGVLILLVMAGGVVVGRHLASRPAWPAPSGSANPPSPGMGPQALAADFARLEARLHALMGVAVGAVGNGHNPMTLGDWQSGPAWSTIKVPLTIAALRAEDPPKVTEQMTAAITESDNAAAEAIWASLGDPVTAAHKVEDVLRATGDQTVVQSQRVRPPFTAFGQTDWSLTNQARFVSGAVCDSANAPIFALMAQIGHDQSWGIGTIADTEYKGGWGPSPSGSYLVRQIGILNAPAGRVAVAIAAQPASGSFDEGTRDLTEVGSWLTAHVASMPAGQCGP